MSELVTIRQSENAVDAEICKAMLESENIEVILFDANMNHLYANAVGGVRINVKEEDVERSKEILKNIDEQI